MPNITPKINRVSVTIEKMKKIEWANDQSVQLGESIPKIWAKKVQVTSYHHPKTKCIDGKYNIRIFQELLFVPEENLKSW